MPAEGASDLLSVAVLTDRAGGGSRHPGTELGMPREVKGCERGACELAHRARVGPITSARATARDTEQPSGAMMLAAAGGAASTASPPRVGDAGNGYPASPWTVTRGTSGEGPSGSAGQVAAVGRVRARSLGVECFGGYS
jgi:hypothetical protein